MYICLGHVLIYLVHAFWLWYMENNWPADLHSSFFFFNMFGTKCFLFVVFSFFFN